MRVTVGHITGVLGNILAVVGRRYILYVCLMTVTGVMEAVSLASVVPLLAAIGVGSADAAGAGIAGRAAVAVLGAVDVAPTALPLGMFVVAALVVTSALFLTQAYVGASLQAMYVYRWQQRLVSSMFAARWGYFLDRRQGDLVNALVTETQRLAGAFYYTGLLLTGMVHGTLFLVTAAALSSVTTALVVTGGAALFLATRLVVHRAYGIGAGISHENASLQSLAVELISGAKLVKATATEGEAVRVLTGTADRLRRHYVANAFDVQMIKAVFDFGAAAIGAGILLVSRLVVGGDPAVTLVVLALFVRLMPKLSGVQHSLQSLSLTLPAVELVQRIAREAEHRFEPAGAETLPRPLQDGPLAVSLRNVHVRYGEVLALAGVTIDVAPGSCIAFVGGSGAGKSSLVDAVLGLVPVSAGQISLNGVPLEQVPVRALRRRIGYVGQETVLYNASIRDNITWGRSVVSPEALDAATRVAGARALIARLPRGYDTPVGDRGSLLSGGERQRLGLARAALGNPGLLILDEATSALDAETERMVTDAVSALKPSSTVIIVAHRLSSVRIADTIYVLEEGRIVEQGSWDQLIERRGRLYQLWTLQHRQERSANAEI